MTHIALELKSMAKSALREYISSRRAIDWEQRRYEIARDVLASYTTRYNRDLVEWNPRERAKAALEQADALIELLKTKKGEG